MPHEENPNFDKRFFIRELERLDFLDSEEIGQLFYEGYFKEREVLREAAMSTHNQLKIIRTGT